ncbi:PTS sugar transporter subunit IIB [Clostridium botulinum]|uniref:PTS sugar transporter subunit IIB n=1 Tax=Clostridium botulinum TaxID=1491 RepID=UPI000D123B38|nr:PTS sugar transporter subunit IIB [Clostridium botulinum]AVQ45168.1 PTS sugar transporter subunit IIB [Clostridium botulinum]AVQ48762.1 PTS sugar transporter subunit IIB [Clostridium botulinum]
MKNILLVCCAGMSTSLLVTKMNAVAIKNGIDVKINAVPEAELKKYIDDVDVILLGPQVRYLLNQVREQVKTKGINVDVINSIDYGTMNGEKVLNFALDLIDK